MDDVVISSSFRWSAELVAGIYPLRFKILFGDKYFLYAFDLSFETAARKLFSAITGESCCVMPAEDRFATSTFFTSVIKPEGVLVTPRSTKNFHSPFLLICHTVVY